MLQKFQEFEFALENLDRLRAAIMIRYINQCHESVYKANVNLLLIMEDTGDIDLLLRGELARHMLKEVIYIITEREQLKKASL